MPRVSSAAVQRQLDGAQGERFDAPGFNRTVLQSGGVPMRTFQQRVLGAPARAATAD